MNETLSFSGLYSNKRNDEDIEVKLDVLQFQEDNIFYVYSPALDLMGYGKTQQEARDSWETVLKEYFLYAINKNTLIEDLESHGWKVEREDKLFRAPSFAWMLQHNEQLYDVYDKHDFHKTTFAVPFQA